MTRASPSGIVVAPAVLSLLVTSLVSFLFAAPVSVEAGGSQTGAAGATLDLWEQCGGKNGTCGSPGSGPCADAAWGAPSCKPGLLCVRDVQWWWQCKPPSPPDAITRSEPLAWPLLPEQPPTQPSPELRATSSPRPPSASPPPPPPPPPRSPPTSSLANCAKPYTVKTGDTCNIIARRFNVTFDVLRRANPGAFNSQCTNLDVGQELCVDDISGACARKDTVQTYDTCGTIALRNNITVQRLQTVNGITGDACFDLQVGRTLCVAGGCPLVYTVASGETCTDIAKANGLRSLDALKEANANDTTFDCNSLSVGQRICLGDPSTVQFSPPAVPGTLEEDEQCGGLGDYDDGRCGFTGYGPCIDGPWEAPSCRPGFQCVRNNEWWWFCTAPPPRPSHPPAPPAPPPPPPLAAGRTTCPLPPAGYALQPDKNMPAKSTGGDNYLVSGDPAATCSARADCTGYTLGEEGDFAVGRIKTAGTAALAVPNPGVCLYIKLQSPLSNPPPPPPPQSTSPTSPTDGDDTVIKVILPSVVTPILVALMGCVAAYLTYRGYKSRKRQECHSPERAVPREDVEHAAYNPWPEPRGIGGAVPVVLDLVGVDRPPAGQIVLTLQ